jgi:hypothetical protein
MRRQVDLRNYYVKCLVSGDFSERVRRQKLANQEKPCVLCIATQPTYAMGARTFVRERRLARAKSNRGGDIRQHVILKLRPQCRLQDFSGRGVRDFADKNDVVRHPPFGDLAVEISQ